jgi:hypothetical protein
MKNYRYYYYILFNLTYVISDLLFRLIYRVKIHGVKIVFPSCRGRRVSLKIDLCPVLHSAAWSVNSCPQFRLS